MVRMRAAGGLTLIELMVVVAIIAIITAVAYPSYQEHLLKAKRSEGKAALLKALQLEERAYSASSGPEARYVTDLAPLFGLTAGAEVRSGENPSQGYYTLTAAVDPATGSDLRQGVLITATPAAPFADAGCGTLSITSTGVKNATGTKGAALCWER